MTGAGAETLETSRLRLRPLVPGDLDRLTATWTEPDVSRLLLTQLRNRAELAEKRGAMIEHARRFGMRDVEPRATGELIGRCGAFTLVRPEAGS